MRYFYAAAGYPVEDTCLKAIKTSNYASWPGLTLVNTMRYCPSSDNTIKSYMVQTRRTVRSTRRRLIPSNATDVRDQFQGADYGSKVTTPGNNSEARPPNDSVHLLHVETVHHSKLYIDNTGRFPTRAWSGNQYAMVACHSSNAILVQPFTSQKDVHRLNTSNIIMQRLKDKDLRVDLQILDK